MYASDQGSPKQRFVFKNGHTYYYTSTVVLKVWYQLWVTLLVRMLLLVVHTVFPTS